MIGKEIALAGLAALVFLSSFEICEAQQLGSTETSTPESSAEPAPLPAEGDVAAVRNDVIFYTGSSPLMAIGGAVQFVGAEGSVFGEVVTGKPYSAESVTEFTRVLADGNRITQENRARIWRDGEGRTRREQTLNGVGVWGTGPDPVTVTTINDPVAGVSYVLDPNHEMVRAVPPLQVQVLEDRATNAERARVIEERLDAGPAGPAGQPTLNTRIVVTRDAAAAPGDEQGADGAGSNEAAVERSSVVFPAISAAPIYGAPPSMVTQRTEDLGEQVLEGVLAHGTRTTVTIAAGAIGNERPIEIVTEEWYSSELEALMLRRTTDPRFGETSYRLVNVVLGEPPADLFSVPVEYDVKSDGSVDVGASPGVRVIAPVPGVTNERLERRRFLVPRTAERGEAAPR